MSNRSRAIAVSPGSPMLQGLCTDHHRSVLWLAVGGPIAILLLASACAPPPTEPDPALLEAVNWYTGVAGTVNEARARALLEEAVARETPLAVMWRARVHSTGRMGYPRDEELAREIAETVIRDVLAQAREWYAKAAAAGNQQAREALDRLSQEEAPPG